MANDKVRGGRAVKAVPRLASLLSTILATGALCASCASTPSKPTEAEREGDLHLQMGVNYLVKGNAEMAYFELAKAERLKPRDPEVHFALGTVYLYRNQPERAVESFLKTTDLDPTHADAYNNLGHAYSSLNRWDDAIAASQKALDQIGYQTPEKAFTIMGWAYYRKGDSARALDYLKRAIEIRPDLPDAENRVATIYLEQGRADKAKPILEGVVKRAPNFARARLNMGIVYFREKDLRAARQEFSAVMDLAGKDSEEARLARGYLDLID